MVSIWKNYDYTFLIIKMQTCFILYYVFVGEYNYLCIVRSSSDDAVYLQRECTQCSKKSG